MRGRSMKKNLIFLTVLSALIGTAIELRGMSQKEELFAIRREKAAHYKAQLAANRTQKQAQLQQTLEQLQTTHQILLNNYDFQIYTKLVAEKEQELIAAQAAHAKEEKIRTQQDVEFYKVQLTDNRRETQGLMNQQENLEQRIAE